MVHTKLASARGHEFVITCIALSCKLRAFVTRPPQGFMPKMACMSAVPADIMLSKYIVDVIKPQNII